MVEGALDDLLLSRGVARAATDSVAAVFQQVLRSRWLRALQGRPRGSIGLLRVGSYCDA
jgi:hypothetical protein